MYSGESQQFLCLAGYRPPCLPLKAFHSTTGKQLWHEEIPIQLSGQVGALVVSDGVLYLTDWNGSVVAICKDIFRMCFFNRERKEMPSDYVKDLVDHKQRVAGYMQIVANELFKRAIVHDNSKFSPEEFDTYEAIFPELQKSTYGSQEYKEAAKKLGPAWSHHCQVNDHHPQHFEDGVRGMSLIQLVEMLCDWLAASERSQTDVLQSLAINKKKLHIDDQLFEVLKNTVKEIAPGKLPDNDPLV